MYFLVVCSEDGMFRDNYRNSLIEKILELYIENKLSTSNYRDLLAGIGIEESVVKFFWFSNKISSTLNIIYVIILL